MASQSEMNRLFQFELYDFDLPEGLVLGPGRHRVCVLSTDMIRGIHKALVEEAGEAWGLVFKRCGQLWGSRLCGRLDQLGQEFGTGPVGQMPFQDFVRFTEEYFSFNGWGTLSFGFDHASSRGLVEVRLDHSLFAEALPEVQGPAHPMICGILGSLFSRLSGQDLDCLESSCVTAGDDANRFIITARRRIEPFEKAITRATHAETLARI